MPRINVFVVLLIVFINLLGKINACIAFNSLCLFKGQAFKLGIDYTGNHNPNRVSHYVKELLIAVLQFLYQNSLIINFEVGLG
jgi:hypothetical protein